MKKRLSLSFLLINACLFAAKAQIITLQGKVVDATNGAQRGVPFVNIGFPASAVGTSSNEAGDFILKINQERLADTLTFSSIGFMTLKMSVKTFIDTKNNKKIALKPNDIRLDEVVIKSSDANRLIKDFLKNRDKNYATEPALMQIFCRETMKNAETDQYFTQSEGILEVYKSSVKKNDDHIRLLKGRKKNLSNVYFDEDDAPFVIPEVVNAPAVSVILDVVKNPEFFLLKNNQFNFTQSGYERLNDRLAYAIYFSPKDSSKRNLLQTDGDFYKGVIYLDTATLTMMRAEFELSPRGIRASNLNFTSGETPLNLTKRTFTIDYTAYKNKWYFKSANVENTYTHTKANISLTHRMYNFVTEIKTDAVKKFDRKKDIGEDESLGEKISDFDDSFWAEYNFVKSADGDLDTIQKNINPSASTATAEPNKKMPPSVIVDYQLNKQVNFLNGSFYEAKQLAKKTKKFVFIDVYTTWCGPCKQMAREAFNDEEVAELMNTFFINMQVDAEANGRTIAAMYNVKAYPTTLIIDSLGKVIAENKGYEGVDYFLSQIQLPVKLMPIGELYLRQKAAYSSNKKDFNALLAFAQLRKQLKISNDYLTDDLVENTTLDVLKQMNYQQFVFSNATQLEGKTFDFILNNRDLKLFEYKLQQLMTANFDLAVNKKDKALLKKVLKANIKITKDPSVSDEKNAQLTLKYYEKINNLKHYHESAKELLTKYYLPQLTDSKDSINQLNSHRIAEIGLYYVNNIKEKKYLESIVELILKAGEKYECVELISCQSQLFYRLKDVDKAKALMQKALILSNNAKDIADILDKMNKGIF